MSTVIYILYMHAWIVGVDMPQFLGAYSTLEKCEQRRQAILNTGTPRHYTCEKDWLR